MTQPNPFAFAVCKGNKHEGNELITVVGEFDAACGVAADKQKEAAAYRDHVLATEKDPFWLELFEKAAIHPVLHWCPVELPVDAVEVERWQAASDQVVYFWIKKYQVQA